MCYWFNEVFKNYYLCKFKYGWYIIYTKQDFISEEQSERIIIVILLDKWIP